MNAAELSEVTKRYGRTLALDRLTFSIPQGSICGLIGPNGAGKTTAMGAIAGLLRPTSGTINLLGGGAFNVERHAGRLGIMPQDSMPSAHAPLQASLRYYAQLQGLSAERAADESAVWLKRVRLDDKANSTYGALSNGMRRRFSVAQAMLGAPEFILLDEPTSGLDPELVVELRELIVSMRGTSTILVSSHILSELESMCDHAVFLEKGRCVRQGTMGQITGRKTVTRIRIAVPAEPPKLDSLFPGRKVELKDAQLTISATSEASLEELNAHCLRVLLDHGIGIQEVLSGESLESAYMKGRSGS